MTSTNKTTTSDNHELISTLAYYLNKYERLVWYARKGAPDDEEYWEGWTEEMRLWALEKLKGIENDYPDETAKLKGELPEKFKHCGVELKRGDIEANKEKYMFALLFNSDWEHGFNSGCLAAFRFALTALDTDTYWDEEMEMDMPCGGIEDAITEFPFLDT